jgi:hypothetical protein
MYLLTLCLCVSVAVFKGLFGEDKNEKRNKEDYSENS